MKANILKTFLINLEKEGINLKTIEINIKETNGEIVKAFTIEEDLYDSKTNSILESIIILTNN